jgi:hypothetical protein
MASPDALRAALASHEARARHAETAEFDPAVFVDPDWAALWLRPRDGHVSVLSALPIAVGWLLAQSS